MRASCSVKVRETASGGFIKAVKLSAEGNGDEEPEEDEELSSSAAAGEEVGCDGVD